MEFVAWVLVTASVNLTEISLSPCDVTGMGRLVMVTVPSAGAGNGEVNVRVYSPLALEETVPGVTDFPATLNEGVKF